MAKNLELKILLQAHEKVTKPFQRVFKASETLRKTIAKNEKQLRSELQKTEGDIAATFSDSGNTSSIEISVRGRVRGIDHGTVKTGESMTMKVAMALTYYKYLHNGEVIVEIDPVNFIENVGGVDRLAGQREALGL